MKKFIEQAKLIKEEIISYRRVIHSNPEVGQELPKTKKYVTLFCSKFSLSKK